MIEKLPFTEIHTGGEDMVGRVESRPVSPYEMQHKINELCDAVNAIQKERESERVEIQEWLGIIEAVRKSVNIHEKQIDELQMKAEPEKCETPAENVQPDYVTTSYMTDGHTKEYYGQKGASIITEHPLPAGYVITIKEPETKGGNND